jgi:hypothetical protein
MKTWKAILIVAGVVILLGIAWVSWRVIDGLSAIP